YDAEKSTTQRKVRRREKYDAEKSKTRVKTIGAAGGHVSKNFLVDLSEHLCIPRLTRSTNGSLREAELVELD
ncbi:MAG: hypothetical protein ACPGLY_25060, partial [Rubripirellula sp.]